MHFKKGPDGQIWFFCVFFNGGGGLDVNFDLSDGSPFSSLIGQNFLTMVKPDQLKHQSLWQMLFSIIR